MIKLKISKDKFIAIISSITGIRNKIYSGIPHLEYNLLRAQANAHVYILDDLSRKMRSKLVLMENMQGSNKITFSVNEMQAFVIVSNSNVFTHSAYAMSVMNEVGETIFKRLLI